MKIGCCSDDIDDHLRIEQSGFDYIELPVSYLCAEQPIEEYEEIRDNILSWEIKPEVWYDFVPENISVTGEEVDIYRLEKLTRTVCERMEELGGEVLVFYTKPVPDGFSPERAFEQTIEFLSLAGKISGAYGITIAVEPISSAQIDTISEGLRIIRAVNNPFVKLLADTFHMNSKSQMIVDIANGGEDIVHVHLNSLTPIANEDICRKLFKKLYDVGYDNRISLHSIPADIDIAKAVEKLRTM